MVTAGSDEDRTLWNARELKCGEVISLINDEIVSAPGHSVESLISQNQASNLHSMIFLNWCSHTKLMIRYAAFELLKVDGQPRPDSGEAHCFRPLRDGECPG